MDFRELAGNRKVQILAVAVLIGFYLIFLQDLNPATIDLNLGIEFIGGVRIPISLEKPVDALTMGSMVDVIKTRINKFGLSQAVVRPLGNSEIIVEIPRADSSVIKHVEAILREQGHFEAVIDGRQALSGEGIIPNAVGGPQAEFVSQDAEGRVTWEIFFAITGEAQERFAEVASGKYGFPVLMFLDRPENALVLADRATVLGGDVAVEQLLQEAMRKEGDDILLFYVDDFPNNQQQILDANRSTVVVPDSLKEEHPEVISFLERNGFEFFAPTGLEITNESIEKRIVERPAEDFAPDVTFASLEEGAPGQALLGSWNAIGLMSAPTLRVEPIQQRAITQYTISGTAEGETPQEQEQNAINEIKTLKSVLSGGKLPVSTVVGSYYDVAPQLGEKFLLYSALGTLLAITAVATLIIIRYRKIKLIFPIVIVNSLEIILTLAVIGGFGTLDLSAMAGIIALIGMGVNDQIIITDEMLKRRGKSEDVVAEEHRVKSMRRDARERVKKAFYIVFTAAGIAIASMLPLLLSGIVEITGFALAAIIGVLIGVGLTRPVYGVIMEMMFGHAVEGE